MDFEVADRVKRLPPYLFAEIEKAMKEKKAQGVDLISLSIGDPDLPPPPVVIDALKEEAPHIFDAWGRPSVLRYVWQRRSFIPFSGSVTRRTYRRELAAFPKSRAWASWLFVAHWMQVAAVAWCLWALVRGGA